MQNPNHYVIIMAGGIGSRFWPMSRSSFPKQFHDILGTGKTLIQDTFDRFANFIPTENIYVVTNDRYYDLVKDQLPALSDNQVLLEPIGRNTAPCVAYAAYKINKINPNAVFVVAPSDHLIQKEEVFKSKVLLGLEACEAEDIIMTLGITPTRPDTGYGYIQYIEDKENKGFYKVKTFAEKPELPIAKRFLESGDYVWNAGIFLFSASTILRSFDEHLPEVADLFKNIQNHYYEDSEKEAIGEAYASCISESMDFGIMEKAENVHVIHGEFGWSDLGTWGSVHGNSDKDFHNNAVQGEVIAYESFNNMIKTTKKDKIVVVKGLDGFIIVDTDDALLICKREDEQFIKNIVGDLKSNKGEPYV